MKQTCMCCGTLLNVDSANFQCDIGIPIGYIDMEVSKLEIFDGPFITNHGN